MQVFGLVLMAVVRYGPLQFRHPLDVEQRAFILSLALQKNPIGLDTVGFEPRIQRGGANI